MLLLLGVAGGAALAVGLIPDEDGSIHGCFITHNNVNEPQGQIRVVSSEAECRNNETPITWNQEGPPGDKGDKGDKGDMGDKGDKGDPSQPGASLPEDALCDLERRINAATPTFLLSIECSRIVFHTNRDSVNFEIYVLDPNNLSTSDNLTGNEVGDFQPDWSPDGVNIAFMSQRDGNNEIYVMNADGSLQTNLTNNGALNNGSPDWSPDGKMIAFQSDLHSAGNIQIYVMDHGSPAVQTRLTNEPQESHHPSWSPDGKEIVFMRHHGGDKWDIYVLEVANPYNQTRLTNNSFRDNFPAWSPDGKSIVFTSTRDGIDSEVYVMDAVFTDANGDGENDSTRLTDNDFQETLPTWSPDSSKIAFGRAVGDGNWRIFEMEPVADSMETALTPIDVYSDGRIGGRRHRNAVSRNN